MRFICQKVAAVSVAVVVLCAVATSSASASQWWLAGSPLTGSTALAKTVKVEEGISLTMLGGSAKITCSSATLYEEGKESLAIVAPGTLNMGMVLGGCAESAPANCSVEKTIGTEPLVATATTGAFPEDKIALKAQDGIFATLDFRGASCTLAGEKPFTGTFTLLLPTGQEELVEQALAGRAAKKVRPELNFLGPPDVPVG